MVLPPYNYDLINKTHHEVVIKHMSSFFKDSSTGIPIIPFMCNIHSGCGPQPPIIQGHPYHPNFRPCVNCYARDDDKECINSSNGCHKCKRASRFNKLEHIIKLNVGEFFCVEISDREPHRYPGSHDTSLLAGNTTIISMTNYGRILHYYYDPNYAYHMKDFAEMDIWIHPKIILMINNMVHNLTKVGIVFLINLVNSLREGIKVEEEYELKHKQMLIDIEALNSNRVHFNEKVKPFFDLIEEAKKNTLEKNNLIEETKRNTLEKNNLDLLRVKLQALEKKLQLEKTELDKRSKNIPRKSMESKEGKRDPYDIFGIDPTTSKKIIVEMYRKLSILYHPDKANNELNKRIFHEKFCEINWAYEQLIK